MRKILSLFAFLLCTYTALCSNDYHKVNVDVLRIRAEPNANSAIRGELKKNDNVAVDKTSGEWSYVRHFLQGDGWVATKYLTAPVKKERIHKGGLSGAANKELSDFVYKIPILNKLIEIKTPSHYLLIALGVLSLLAFIFSFDRDEMGVVSKCIFSSLFVIESIILLTLLAMFASNNLTLVRGLSVHWIGIVGIVVGVITFCIFQLRHLSTLVEIMDEDFGTETNCLFGFLAWPVALITVYIAAAFDTEYVKYVGWAFVASQVIQVGIIAFSSKSILYGILGVLLYIITSIPSLILLLAFAGIVIMITLAILLLSIVCGPVLIGTYVDFWGNIVRVYIR